jgi:hypothetical protein
MLKNPINKTFTLLEVNMIGNALAFASANFKNLTGNQSYSLASAITTLKPYIENLQATQQKKMAELGVFFENNALSSQTFNDARKAIAARYGVELDEKGNPQGSMDNLMDLRQAGPELQIAYATNPEIAAYNKDFNEVLMSEIEISILPLDSKVLLNRQCSPTVAWSLSLLTKEWDRDSREGKSNFNLSHHQAGAILNQFDKFNQSEFGLGSETALKVGTCIDILRRTLNVFAEKNKVLPKTDEERQALEDLANKPQKWFMPSFTIDEFANDEITGIEPSFFLALELLVVPEVTTIPEVIAADAVNPT